MTKINPAWQKAEDSRILAEHEYSTFMKSKEALELREEDNDAWRKKVESLNAKIEAANKKVRITPQEI